MSSFAVIPRLLSRRSRDPLAEACRLVAGSGLFDVSYYLLNAGDVESAGVDPLEHFCRHGWRENRRPNLFFDPGWYAERYGPRLGADENPLAHYVAAGERAGWRPVPFFDPGFTVVPNMAGKDVRGT